MELKGKKVAILLENQFEDLEVLYPYHRLREAGAEVKLLGKSKGASASGKKGHESQADEAVGDAKPADFDGLVIPGGFSPDHMRRTPAFTEFVKAMIAAGKPVAAICHGPWMLCSARALKGKKATSFYSIRDDMENAGAEWVDQEVVVDGNLITSRNPNDLPAFCRELIRALD